MTTDHSTAVQNDRLSNGPSETLISTVYLYTKRKCECTKFVTCVLPKD